MVFPDLVCLFLDQTNVFFQGLFQSYEFIKQRRKTSYVAGDREKTAFLRLFSVHLFESLGQEVQNFEQ